MLKSLRVDEVLGPIWETGRYSREMSWQYDWKLNDTLKLEDEHTYMLIFGPTQDNALKAFKEQFKGKILFEGKKAKNRQHPGKPRNTLVIFETAES